jgi:hypothetical protein
MLRLKLVLGARKQVPSRFLKGKPIPALKLERNYFGIKE